MTTCLVLPSSMLMMCQQTLWGSQCGCSAPADGLAKSSCPCKENACACSEADFMWSTASSTHQPDPVHMQLTELGMLLCEVQSLGLCAGILHHCCSPLATNPSTCRTCTASTTPPATIRSTTCCTALPTLGGPLCVPWEREGPCPRTWTGGTPSATSPTLQERERGVEGGEPALQWGNAALGCLRWLETARHEVSVCKIASWAQAWAVVGATGV